MVIGHSNKTDMHTYLIGFCLTAIIPTEATNLFIVHTSVLSSKYSHSLAFRHSFKAHVKLPA